MGKIKEIINKVAGVVPATYKWIATDGLLHMLACFAIMLAFTPIVGVWWAMGITTAAAIGKEAFDAIKGADIDAINHDFVCDAAGLLIGVLTIALWWVCNL
jgi:hypothetical protein